MKISQKIGLIGVGNMGTSILEGLFQKKIAQPQQVWVYDKIKTKDSEFVRKWKVNAAVSSGELVRKVKIILLAVKPQDLEEVAAAFKISLEPAQLLISILAGTPIAKIQGSLGKKIKIVRAMPNLAAKVGQAITTLAGPDRASVSLAEEIFSGCGKTVRLDEKHFDLVTALSGSGPAYFFALMELISKVGVENGLTKSCADLLAVQTALGAGLLAQSSTHSPEELRMMVTSKGGTTEAALKVLESENFSGIFRKAIKAAANRSKELSGSK